MPHPIAPAVTRAAFFGAEEKILPAASKLREELSTALQEYKTEAESNHLQSPVRRLAMHISRMVRANTLDIEGMGDLVQLLTMNAFLYRARRLRDYVGECAVDENEAILERLFEDLADGGKVPFADFQAGVERAALGIVFTAHPTFTMSEDLTQVLASLATGCTADGKPLGDSDVEGLVKAVAESRNQAPGSVTLADEQHFALMAIANIRRALRRTYATVFRVAQKHYADDWQNLTPRLLSVASWVGYDLDGRADIRWSDTLSMRMEVETLALAEYAESLDAIIAKGGDASALGDAKAALVATLELVQGDIENLSGDTENADRVGLFARTLVESLPARLTSVAAITETLSAEIGRGGPAAAEMAVLRAEMANFGLAFAHTHMRINATQVTNAVRHDIDITSSPEDPANRRRYLREVSELLDGAKPVTINFGSIMSERATAKRVFMLMAQFLKYVDAGEPVRLLIAECNTAFTVLSALYLAKLFGIEDKIDISPLFETGMALEQGHEIVSELLENPHYVAYVKARGRLCIQTGFSDAGRYIGQVPASLAIERIRVKLAEIMSEAGLGDVEVLIFDTHGESIGRGAHPVSFADRLNYTYPPRARCAFKDAGVTVKQEVSFQGGDGYVYFANPDLAFATVTRLLEHALSDSCQGETDTAADAFYDNTDYSLDFFMSVKGFNERLMENPNYAAMLNLFGTNLLYPTGSRKVKRQHEGGAHVDLEHPSQVRAIPHNAVLQQLGYFSNSISGFGKAIGKDQDRFEEVYANSDRAQRFMRLVGYARHLSNLDAMHAYVSVFDPAIWLRRSTVEKDPKRAEQMQTLADILRHSERHEKLNRVYRIFLNDTLYLDHGLKAVGVKDQLPAIVDECYPDLTLLHGVRITLIHELFLIVARLPKFSDMAESSDELIAALLNLDVEHALTVLRKAFPVSDSAPGEKEFGEPASYQTDVEQGYEREHRELFDPLEARYDLIRRISTAVAHMSGAVG